MINLGTLALIEETGKIPMFSIENLEGLIKELERLGYQCKLSSNTDYLLVTKQ